MTQYIGSGYEKFGALEGFCDAVLKTYDGYSFKVHRVILSGNSSYFRALFLFGGCDQSNAEYLLSLFSGRAVSQVLHFLYGGKVFLDADNIVELLLAADYYLLDELLLKCQTFALKHLSLTNCVEIFIASYINERLKLLKCSRRFILLNFGKLLDQPTNELSDIPFELFKSLMEDDSLNIPDERYIWRAVEKWVGNSSERLSAARELLTTIRFCNLNTHLVQYLQKSDILRNNPYMKELNDILLTTKLPELGAIFKNELSSKYPKTDLSRPRQPKRLYLIAKITYERTDLYVTYNEDIYIRRKITLQANNDCQPDHMVVVDHLAYMFRFHTGQGIVFNLLDKSWSEMEIMNRPHSNQIIVHTGHFIYTVGEDYNAPESDSSELLCTFERYDTRIQSWKHLGSTFNSKTAASIGNKIYIHSENPLTQVMTIEVYDTISGTFSSIPAPPECSLPREGYNLRAMIAYDNQLFVIEGSDDNGSLNVVEVYSPETCIWKKFQSLPCGLIAPGVRILDDKLIVFDEFEENWSPVFWNKKAKVWEPFRSKCLHPMKKHLFCPIEDCDSITCLMNENFSCEQNWEFFEDEIF
ncbi:Kelch-like protein 9 [Araneus ventricosus]|uniref:Kelch-like protein 9 n=1 Tax=Araneus ventricosus TaxID=182803 RepID=A0A4Y2W1D5_ARAVE|nr:Kelch-like protein 9 [Araneus ventricosus]